MKFIHVASYKDEFFNGIKSVLMELVPEQRNLGHKVYVFNQDYNEREIISGEVYIPTQKEFERNVNLINPDFVILHSLYGISDLRFSWFLNKKKIPYLIEPHGGTTIENAKKNWLKKKFANIIYANRFINKAAGLIYLNEIEANECVFKEIRKNFAIVPNGTHVHEIQKKNTKSKVHFIFLSRIDIIQKGLDLLFPALDQFNKSPYKEKAEFHFYGKARLPEFEKAFNDYIDASGNNIFFHGPVVGEDKTAAFRDADIFILTSRYEGMPMAVLEALSYGVPCLLTPQTNVANIVKSEDCGWITELKIDSIVKCIIDAIIEYENKRDQLIVNSLNAARKFTWDRIASISIQEYSRIIDLS